jgi:glutathione S-transferase
MKLYGFKYSPYARKIEWMLARLGKRHTWIEQSYLDRRELALLTGGYIHVPVLVRDDGAALFDSRAIALHLLAEPEAKAQLVPAPLDGPMWAYHDFCDGPLEDVLFRLSAPAVADHKQDPGERAMYVLIKERRYGAGCITAWRRERADLITRARALLGPTLATLAAQPFVFGSAPTLADAALYSQLVMAAADPELPGALDPRLSDYLARVTAAAGLGASPRRD